MYLYLPKQYLTLSFLSALTVATLTTVHSAQAMDSCRTVHTLAQFALRDERVDKEALFLRELSSDLVIYVYSLCKLQDLVKMAQLSKTTCTDILKFINHPSFRDTYLLPEKLRHPSKKNTFLCNQSMVEADQSLGRIQLARIAGNAVEWDPNSPCPDDVLINISQIRSPESIDRVKILTSFGASINAVSMDGLTPVHYAARAGDRELVKFLIHQSHINLNIVPSFSNPTLMQYANTWNDADLRDALIAKGESPDDTDINGHTPLRKALGNLTDLNKFQEILDTIKPGDVDKDSLDFAVSFMNDDVVRRVLAKSFFYRIVDSKISLAKLARVYPAKETMQVLYARHGHKIGAVALGSAFLAALYNDGYLGL